MNYNELLFRLSKISPDEYGFEAKLLLEAFTDIKYSYIIAHKDESIYSKELEEALMRRENREPIQYIIGKWDFYRQSYLVNESCLIPRSDTEILVEKAIELMPKKACFLDLCTGSGCIAVSVLAECADTTAILVDKFDSTLSLAKENAELNGVCDRADFLNIDILNDNDILEQHKFDAVLSNPPYIRPEIIEGLSEEVKHEPYAALYGGDDGLLFYRRILSYYSRYVKKGGFMLLEIGYDQAFDVSNIAKENGYSCEIIKDYGSNDRVALIKGF